MFGPRVMAYAAVASLVVTAAFVSACDGDDDRGPTATATVTGEATAEGTPRATATASPAATATAEPTAEPAGTSTPSTGASTGIEAVDAVIEAVTAGDADALAERMRLVETECTETQGMGGPPKCFNAPGDPPDGTPVQAFPFLGCELEWEFDTTEFARLWIVDATRLFAAVRLDRPLFDEADELGIAQGEHAVIFQGQVGHALVLDEHGDVVAAISACGGDAASLLADAPPFHNPEVVLRGEAFDQ